MADIFPAFQKYTPGSKPKRGPLIEHPEPIKTIAATVTTPPPVDINPVIKAEANPISKPEAAEVPTPGSKPLSAVELAIHAAKSLGRPDSKNQTLAADGLPIPAWYAPNGPASHAPVCEVGRNWVQAFHPVCERCLSSVYIEKRLSDGRVDLSCACCMSKVDGEAKLDLAERRKKERLAAKSRLHGRFSK